MCVVDASAVFSAEQVSLLLVSSERLQLLVLGSECACIQLPPQFGALVCAVASSLESWEAAAEIPQCTQADEGLFGAV